MVASKMGLWLACWDWVTAGLIYSEDRPVDA